ncbi:histidinol-phosphatase (PHP family) [Capronia epimyces CBS 606.96]|uniref:Histidinol-phosphatase n=1 Tax=Capronia epimyces CBS 606.96 TaxID=1182542 RepID=W9XV37_9EURO|nr:histidinol-phosphatase (PHP family) [Capronia epimyces CBS 606.96]EXJ80836.1 histidinol-phosphatase (PHP family) [Capronia epimyces CBS 606.96]
MPFSHHSHSGQFCPGHAQDSLEEIVLTAISKNIQDLALTEHMPRHDQDSYPEEIKAGVTLAWHLNNEKAYVAEAKRLRQKYASRIGLPLGFEGEWIRPGSVDLINQSIKTYQYDFFIGSVHHVHTVPIDYDRQMYEQARDIAGGTDEQLFADYFDSQLAMLQAVKPPVVGHFDLIRLKSDHPNAAFQSMPDVWQRILRNLDFIASYHGVMEVNTAALRKGMDEPYPTKEICQAALSRGIRFCLSDDSHGVGQLASHYERALSFLDEVGMTSVTVLRHAAAVETASHHDDRFPTLRLDQIELSQVRELAFWGKRPATQHTG